MAASMEHLTEVEVGALLSAAFHAFGTHAISGHTTEYEQRITAAVERIVVARTAQARTDVLNEAATALPRGEDYAAYQRWLRARAAAVGSLRDEDDTAERGETERCPWCGGADRRARPARPDVGGVRCNSNWHFSAARYCCEACDAAQRIETVAADLYRNHDMPPKKDSRSYSFRMGWWEGVHHAASVVKKAARAAGAEGGERDD